MPLVVVTAVLLSLAIYVVPVLLLQRKDFRSSHDYFVSSGRTPPGVFQNSAIAYALQMATFGPYFLWGAAGDYWPPIVNSFFFGIGLWTVYLLRHRLFSFLNDALKTDKSITVHEFLSRQHGNSPAVRIFASGLTIFALLGLVLGEILGIAALLKPLLFQNVDATYVFIFSMLLLMFLYTIVSGNSGVMRSDQAQMGMAYVGLFGGSAILLSNPSATTKLEGHVALASLFMAAIPALMILYRKGQFIETRVISLNQKQTNSGHAGVKAFRGFELALNAAVILTAGALILYAVKAISGFGMGSSLSASFAALRVPTSFSFWGYVALILLPLFYQVVDITNWQRIASQVKDQTNVGDGNPDDKVFRRVFMIYSIESPLMWILMCLFGGLAVSAMDIKAGDTAFVDFVSKVVRSTSTSEIWISILLLVGIFAIGLSTMSSIFSATLLAVRDDLLPAIYGRGEADLPAQVREQGFIRKTTIVGVLFYTIIVFGFYLADGVLKIKFGSEQFLAILFAFYCAQLAFVPLILGPLWQGKDGAYGTVTTPWALGVLGTGAIVGVVSQAVFLVSGNDGWLWGAVPLCLVVSWSVFAIGRLALTNHFSPRALRAVGAAALLAIISVGVFFVTGRDSWLWGAAPLCLVVLWSIVTLGRVALKKHQSKASAHTS
jgi:hypothetical protein